MNEFQFLRGAKKSKEGKNNAAYQYKLSDQNIPRNLPESADIPGNIPGKFPRIESLNIPKNIDKGNDRNSEAITGRKTEGNTTSASILTAATDTLFTKKPKRTYRVKNVTDVSPVRSDEKVRTPLLPPVITTDSEKTEIRKTDTIGKEAISTDRTIPVPIPVTAPTISEPIPPIALDSGAGPGIVPLKPLDGIGIPLKPLGGIGDLPLDMRVNPLGGSVSIPVQPSVPESVPVSVSVPVSASESVALPLPEAGAMAAVDRSNQMLNHNLPPLSAITDAKNVTNKNMNENVNEDKDKQKGVNIDVPLPLPPHLLLEGSEDARNHSVRNNVAVGGSKVLLDDIYTEVDDESNKSQKSEKSNSRSSGDSGSNSTDIANITSSSVSNSVGNSLLSGPVVPSPIAPLTPLIPLIPLIPVIPPIPVISVIIPAEEAKKDNVKALTVVNANNEVKGGTTVENKQIKENKEFIGEKVTSDINISALPVAGKSDSPESILIRESVMKLMKKKMDEITEKNNENSKNNGNVVNVVDNENIERNGIRGQKQDIDSNIGIRGQKQDKEEEAPGAKGMSENTEIVKKPLDQQIPIPNKNGILPDQVSNVVIPLGVIQAEIPVISAEIPIIRSEIPTIRAEIPVVPPPVVPRDVAAAPIVRITPPVSPLTYPLPDPVVPVVPNIPVVPVVRGNIVAAARGRDVIPSNGGIGGIGGVGGAGGAGGGSLGGVAGGNVNSIACSGTMDPFAGQPVDTFSPPVTATLALKSQWADAVKEMLTRIGRMRIGGDKLRMTIKEEISVLQALRITLFCSYV